MTKLQSPMIQPRHFIDVADYVPANDTEDCWDGIQAAMQAAEGRELRFTTPYNGSRTYRLTNRAKGTIVGMRRGVIECDSNAVVSFAEWGTVGLGAGGTGQAWAKSEGVFAAGVTVTATAAAKQNQVTVSNAAGFVRGSKIVINTTEQYTPMEGEIGDIGEWNVVSSVSGNVLTLITDLRHTYNPALGTVKVHRATNLCGLTFRGMNFIGPGILDGAIVEGSGPRGDRGYEVINADYVRIEGGEVVDSDLYQYMLTTVREIRASASFLKTQHQPVGDSRQRYHIGFGGVIQSSYYYDGLYVGGTEQISPTTTGGETSVSPEGLQGLKDTIIISGNIFRGAWRSGVGPHHAYVDLQIENNKFFSCNQAADMRLGGRFWNNHVIQSNIPAGAGGLDCAVQLGAGMLHLDAGGNAFDDVLRGYWMPPNVGHWRAPSDVRIMNDVMRGVRAHGVLLDYNGDGAGGLLNANLGSLTVKADIQLSSAASAPIGVQAKGRWSNVGIDVKVEGGPATNARSVFLTRPVGSASTTDGPINPIIRTRQTANLDVPLIQYPANGAGSVSSTVQIFGAP